MCEIHTTSERPLCEAVRINSMPRQSYYLCQICMYDYFYWNLESWKLEVKISDLNPMLTCCLANYCYVLLSAFVLFVITT